MTLRLDCAVLTFTEQMLLLLLDDETGTFVPIPRTSLTCALAGAVLMDLAFANRIDTDLETLTVTDRTPTGTLMLDRALAKIGVRKEAMDTRSWIKLLSVEDAESIREQALQGLVLRGILARRPDSFRSAFQPGLGVLERGERSFLRALDVRRYRMIDVEAEREVRRRIGRVLLSDDIPDPRDVALIGLADACDILGNVFPDRSIEAWRPRVDRLRNMDLIGRELAGAISDIEHNVRMAVSGAAG